MQSTRLTCATLMALLAIYFSANVYAGPPAESGIVTRGERPDFGLIVDQKAGMLVVLGLDPVEFCQGNFDPDIVADMVVDIPVDPDRIALFVRGEFQASVWDFVQFDCDLFTALQPLATGMAIGKSTDNDYNVAPTPNANAYGFTARGTLYDTTGAPKRLHAVYRALWDKDVGEAIVKISKVKLK